VDSDVECSDSSDVGYSGILLVFDSSNIGSLAPGLTSWFLELCLLGGENPSVTYFEKTSTRELGNFGQSLVSGKIPVLVVATKCDLSDGFTLPPLSSFSPSITTPLVEKIFSGVDLPVWWTSSLVSGSALKNQIVSRLRQLASSPLRTQVVNGRLSFDKVRWDQFLESCLDYSNLGNR
jgi:hypothetical protein